MEPAGIEPASLLLPGVIPPSAGQCGCHYHHGPEIAELLTSARPPCHCLYAVLLHGLPACERSVIYQPIRARFAKLQGFHLLPSRTTCVWSYMTQWDKEEPT